MIAARSWYLWPILLALLLTACAAPPVRPPSEHAMELWQARASELGKLQTWDLHGRLSVHAGDEGGQVTLHWQHAPTHEALDFTSPLGQGLLRFTQDACGAVARDAKGGVRSASDLQTLVYDLTAWRIPIAGLQYWIRGLPAPGAPSVPTLDDAGRLRTLDQSGWSMRIADYVTVGTLELPSRLFLRYSADADSGSPPIDLRLAIESWTL